MQYGWGTCRSACTLALWESRACPFSRRVLHRTMAPASAQLVAVCVCLEGWLRLV